MNTKLKKILIILVIILVIALIVFLLYNFLLKKQIEKWAGKEGRLPAGKEAEFGTREGRKAEGEEGIIPSPELKIKAISTEKVLSPTLSSDKTKVIYYSQSNGNVWQSSFDGSNLTRISSAILNNLVKIIWSPDKTKVISVYQNEENITKFLYDYTTSKATPLNPYIQEIAFSSDSSQIVYQYLDKITHENNLNIANPDGTNWKNILNLRMKDINLEWLNSEIAFWEKPSGLAQSSLFRFDPLSKQLTKVLSNNYGMAVKWSFSKDKVLYSTTNSGGKNINLYVALKDGSNETNINISGLVEKCVWSQDNRTLFCAIPKNINDANVLPDDFYKGSFVSDDDFWKINLETGERTPLLEPQERGEKTYDAVDLFLSPLEDYLFFVNKKDGLLYSIEL